MAAAASHTALINVVALRSGTGVLPASKLARDFSRATT